MQCPVCKSLNQSEMTLHAEGFHEGIYECDVCESSWSVNHGLTEVVTDTQQCSFLEAITETVDADDYCFAA